MDELTEDAVREIEQIHSSGIKFEVAGESHGLAALCADDIELWPPAAQPVLGRTARSTAVPYSFEYGRFMLTIGTIGDDGKPITRYRFQHDGIYTRLYGIPLGRGHHPVKALIEDAVKWIHAGGLDDSLQNVQ